MTQPSLQIRQILLAALWNVEQSRDLSPEEVEWVRQYAARMITEFAVLKSEVTDRPIAA